MLCLVEVVTGSGKRPVCEEIGRCLFLANLFLIPSIVIMHYNDPAVRTDSASTQDHHKQNMQRIKVHEGNFSAEDTVCLQRTWYKMAVHGEWLSQNIPLQKLNSMCRQQGYPHQASRGWGVLAAQCAGVAFLRATFWTGVQKEKVQRQICFKIVLYFRKKRGKATTLVDFSLNIPNICLQWT